METVFNGHGVSAGCFSPLPLPPIFFERGNSIPVTQKVRSRKPAGILVSVPWKPELAVWVLQFEGSVPEWAALTLPTGLF